MFKLIARSMIAFLFLLAPLRAADGAQAGGKVATQVYLISHPGNVGDTNQLKGVERMLEVQAGHRAIEIQFLDAKNGPANADAINTALGQGKRVVVVGAGEGGVEGIRALKPQPGLSLYHMSHMALGAYKDKDFVAKLKDK